MVGNSSTNDLSPEALVTERGVVENLFPAEDYGLLRTEDGRELLFRRCEIDGEFEQLTIGTAVRFREVLTDRGPEAIDVVRAY